MGLMGIHGEKICTTTIIFEWWLYVTIMGTIICTMICTTIMGINKVIICTNIEWLYVNGINNRIANYNNLVDTLTY